MVDSGLLLMTGVIGLVTEPTLPLIWGLINFYLVTHPTVAQSRRCKDFLRSLRITDNYVESQSSNVSGMLTWPDPAVRRAALLTSTQ
jgi:hypothetical protein